MVDKVIRGNSEDARENGLNNCLQIDACCMQGLVRCLYGAGGMSQVVGLKDHVGWAAWPLSDFHP